jgi:hypothetical protein
LRIQNRTISKGTNRTEERNTADKTEGNKKKQRILAWPPRDYQWIEGIDEIEKLSAIYSKLEAIAGYFSYFRSSSTKDLIDASMVYGFWFILRDICKELADILKVDHWTGEIGKKADEGDES